MHEIPTYHSRSGVLGVVYNLPNAVSQPVEAVCVMWVCMNDYTSLDVFYIEVRLLVGEIVPFSLAIM